MKKAGIDISGQSIIGLILGVVIVGLIIILASPGFRFFLNQQFNTKMEKNLMNLKETAIKSSENGSEIIIDAQGYALVVFSKDQEIINCGSLSLLKKEECKGKGCVCACKVGKLGILHDEGCINGKCNDYEEDVKTNANCGIVLKNELNNLVVTKKSNEITINKK